MIDRNLFFFLDYRYGKLTEKNKRNQKVKSYRLTSHYSVAVAAKNFGSNPRAQQTIDTSTIAYVSISQNDEKVVITEIQGEVAKTSCSSNFNESTDDTCIKEGNKQKNKKVKQITTNDQIETDKPNSEFVFSRGTACYCRCVMPGIVMN